MPFRGEKALLVHWRKAHVILEVTRGVFQGQPNGPHAHVAHPASGESWNNPAFRWVLARVGLSLRGLGLVSEPTRFPSNKTVLLMEFLRSVSARCHMPGFWIHRQLVFTKHGTRRTFLP